MKLFKYNYRVFIVLIHDIIASGLAWVGAYWLRFNLQFTGEMLASLSHTLKWVLPVQATVYLVFGLYRGIWRYASLPDLKRILMAIMLAALVLPAVFTMVGIGATEVPRSVLIIDPILLLLIMGGSRLAYRSWKEHRLYGVWRKSGEPVLVLGAGEAAVALVKELSHSEEWRVVGLLDDDLAKHKRLLHGVRVLGRLEGLSLWAEEEHVKHAIIAMPSASPSIRRKAVDICSEAGIKVLTVPSFRDLISGKVTISQVRHVEVEDLLGREPVLLDNKGLTHLLNGRAVMVTGAGGSIGSELCRQIAQFEPSLLILFELNEYFLYRLREEFHQTFPNLEIVTAVGDVKDGRRVHQVIRQYSPMVIFHAAAYKHVPMMEEVNAWEAVRNNVLGTYTLANAAIQNGVKKFVLISTDKAVNPTNVMGASKRLAEMVCTTLQGMAEVKFGMVRFGNVLGSAGSVIPKFEEQIAKGGPITVTHPEIIRYFMSIPEAAQLVLQAAHMGGGGEIFVMDMGEPIKIVDLAREMIHVAGLSEDDIKIVYTGLRPGEKLYEELLADHEHTRPSGHPKLRIAKSIDRVSLNLEELVKWLNQPKQLLDEEVRRDLARWVPEYSSAARPPLRAVNSEEARSVSPI